MKRNLIVALEVLLVCAVLGAGTFFFLKKSPEQKAFDASLAQAKQGDASAQTQVAAAYLAGTPVKQNTAQAVEWYLKAAAQGNATAAYELGQLYLTGEQVERDIASGVSYLKLAASKNHAGAQYALGRLYQTGTEELPQHQGQAVWWWLQATAQGDEDAKAALEQAKAEQPDLVDRVQTIFDQEKAGQTDGAAAFAVAQAYQGGQWVEKDMTKALSWLEKAATLKNAPAQYALYEFYLQPEGTVEANEEKALEYLQQAAENGSAVAQRTIAERIYQVAQSAEEQQIAWQWLQLASAQNDPAALYMSGIMTMQGQGTPANAAKAIEFFKQAAELGHTDAQYVLGQSYWYGVGVRPSKALARKWLELARDNGSEKATELLKEVK